jgi:hypothetical protein
LNVIKPLSSPLPSIVLVVVICPYAVSEEPLPNGSAVLVNVFKVTAVLSEPFELKPILST